MPDVEHEERLTVILRCVVLVGISSVEDVEHFVGYFIFNDTVSMKARQLYCRLHSVYFSTLLETAVTDN